MLACVSDMVRIMEPKVPDAVAEYHCDGTGISTDRLLLPLCLSTYIVASKSIVLH